MPEKHIPLRMCVVCRKMLPKKDLIRLVTTPEGLKIDATQRLDGRGYWISRDKAVLDQAKKRHFLNKILKKNVPDSFYEELEAFVGE